MTVSVAERYLAELHDLVSHTEALLHAAENGDWDELLADLEKRQAVMDRIDGLVVDLSQLPEQHQTTVRLLLQRVASLDQDVSRKVQVAMVNIRSAMDGARLASTTVAAYRKAMSPGAQTITARFVDRQK